MDNENKGNNISQNQVNVSVGQKENLDNKNNIIKSKKVLDSVKNLDAKQKKMFTIGFIVLVIIIGIVLFISGKNSGFGKAPTNADGTLVVDTGAKWGNLYSSFIQKEMAGYSSYDVSLVDVDFNGTPEMLVQYVDSEEKEDLKILYIKDGKVFSSKVFRIYSLHLIYSIEDKDIKWYIRLSSREDRKKYGTYTDMGKIIAGEAFKADIDVTNETLLSTYSDRYVESNYKIVFYQLNTADFEDDIKNVVNRYEGYNDKVEKAKDTLFNENNDKEYVPPVVPDEDNFIIVAGRKLNFGNYFGSDSDGFSYNIVLNNRNTLILDGTYVTFEIVDGGELKIGGSDKVIQVVGNDSMKYDNIVYNLLKDNNQPENNDIPVSGEEIPVEPSVPQEPHDSDESSDVVDPIQ